AVAAIGLINAPHPTKVPHASTVSNRRQSHIKPILQSGFVPVFSHLAPSWFPVLAGTKLGAKKVEKGPNHSVFKPGFCIRTRYESSKCKKIKYLTNRA